MKVKIGTTIIDSEKESFMITFEPHEKRIIGNMGIEDRLLLTPEGLVLPTMNAYHKWEIEIHKMECDEYKQDITNSKEVFCGNCEKANVCDDNWMSCKSYEPIQEKDVAKLYKNALTSMRDYNNKKEVVDDAEKS